MLASLKLRLEKAGGFAVALAEKFKNINISPEHEVAFSQIITDFIRTSERIEKFLDRESVSKEQSQATPTSIEQPVVAGRVGEPLVETAAGED